MNVRSCMYILACLLMTGQTAHAQSTLGTGSGPGSYTVGGWNFDSKVKLPQNWVNNNEWIGTTTNVINFPNGWTCATTSYPVLGSPGYLGGNYLTGSALQNFTGLQQAVNDAETCRTNTNAGTQINIVNGTVFSNALGLGLPQTAGDNSTNFIVLQSTTPLPVGQTVCSHGIQDNIPQSTQPGIRNLGCNGQNMSYQLGVDVYNTAGVSGGPPVTGPFTLANPGLPPTNTSNYNDIASMYTIESTQTNGSAIWTCNATSTTTCPANADPTGTGPHHFAILNAEVRMGAGLWQVASPIKIGQGGETAVSQLPSHIHLGYLYVHGDWGDAPVTGAGANAVATSSPQGANQNPNDIVFQGCIYCSITYNYHDKTLRPGQEGHIVAFNFVHQIKLVHNWFEGQSIGHMCGGAGGPVSLNPWSNGVIVPANIFVECQDMEDRANRWTYPYSWMLAGNVPGPIGPFRPASSMSTTNSTVTNPSANGLVLNLQTARNAVVSSVAVQAGGTGYTLNDIVTAQQRGLGQNAKFMVSGVSGGVVNAVLVASGQNYTVNNPATPITTNPVGTGSGMQVNITSVGPNGEITGVAMVTPGSGYTNANLITIPQTGASGGQVQPAAVSGVVTAIGVITPGSNYSPTATGSPATTTTVSGGGSGMTVNITSVDTNGQLLALTVANAGSGYSTNSVINVVQSGASNGQIQPTTVTTGVPTAINVVSGTGYQVNSFGRKNAHEYKWSDRVILDGNIFENVDYTGAQGTSVSFKVNQTSASNPGTNYWTQQTNTTMTNNIIRSGCNGTSMGFRSNPSAGGGVALRADYYVYTNNLVYNISMGGSTVNPGCQQSPGPYNLRVAAATNGTTWGQTQSAPNNVPATFPADAVTVSRDSTGHTATLVLGGWGRGYIVDNGTLTTSAVGTGSNASTSGSGLTVRVQSVDSYGEITGVQIVTPGTGYVAGDGVIVQSQAGTTVPAALSILQVSSGAPQGVALGIPNKGVSGFAPGDVIMVTCSDHSFDTFTGASGWGTTVPAAPTDLTGWPASTLQVPQQMGVKVSAANPFNLIVSYPNNGPANASVGPVPVSPTSISNCFVTNVQGDPSYLYANHNSHFMRLYTGQKTGDPGSDNLGGSGNFCGMSTGITFTNSIALGGGATASSLGEGTRTTNCSFDGNQPGSTLTYSYVTHPGRDTIVTCSGHGAGSGGIGACYTEYNKGVITFPPTHIWGDLTAYCQGTNPVTENCQGVVGNMGVGPSGSFNYALPNWHDYRLCHTGDPQCGGLASKFAAGGTQQASDHTDLGANFTALDAAQVATQYCVPSCAIGSYPDHP